MPIGIIGHSNDVIVHSPIFHFGEKLGVNLLVVTAFKVDHHLCVGFFTDGSYTCLQKGAEVVVIAPLSVNFKFTNGPHKSVGDFVAHLHHIKGESIVFYGSQNLNSVLVHCLFKFLHSHILPSLGQKLLAGVCPKVTVMDVKIKFEALIPCQFAKFYDSVKVVVACKIFDALFVLWVLPKAYAHMGDSVCPE